MTCEEQTQKFHTDDVLLSRSGWCFSSMKGNFYPIRSITRIWVVTRHQHGIYALVSQTSFRRETRGGVKKRRLLSQATVQWVYLNMYMKNCGGECGRSVNTSNLRSRGPGFKSRPSRCFLRRGTLLHFVSLYPGVQMGTGDILLGRNPAMDRHPVQGRVAILLGMLHAKETRTNSSRLGLWLVCAFTFLHANLNLPALSYQGIFYSVCCNVFPVLTVGLGYFLLFWVAVFRCREENKMQSYTPLFFCYFL